MTEQFLSPQQLQSFNKDGFLIVPSVIDEKKLNAIRSAMSQRVSTLLNCYHQTQATPPPSENFQDNLTTLLQTVPEAYQHIDISLPMTDYVEKDYLSKWQSLFGENWYDNAGIYIDKTIVDLISNPNIVNIACQLIGEEVIASPVQHVRIKPPQKHISNSGAASDANTARTLWHQDEAVVSEEARGADILTVWVAITDATIENGCMWAVRASHGAADDASLADFGLTVHCPTKKVIGDIYIPDEKILNDQLVALEAKAGDVVLLHKRTIHGAKANCSPDIRWSFDLRFQQRGTPSGRSFFPSFTVASVQHPEEMITFETYQQRWFDARDQILAGKITPVFNTRWNKYFHNQICA